MTEIIDGIETRNRGGIIEHRHVIKEFWHPADNLTVMKKMIKIHDENIILSYSALYKSCA